jgi:hypothetical protein
MGKIFYYHPPKDGLKTKSKRINKIKALRLYILKYHNLIIILKDLSQFIVKLVLVKQILKKVISI